MTSHAWIMARVQHEGECWTWTGWKANGYGQVKGYGKAHRLSYEIHVGAIPEGLELDHLCRNTLCVNPDHLEPVTHAENVRRGLVSELKTHCDSGRHPRTSENQVRRSNGSMTCGPCRRELARIASAIPAPPRTPPSHCRNGHPYDEANTYYTRSGWFKCRKCRADGMRRRTA